MDLDVNEPIYVGQDKSISKARAKAEKLAALFEVNVRDLTENSN